MKTIRQDIMDILRDRYCSARDISKLMGLREREVYDHLTHIEKSLHEPQRLIIEPSKCLSCGFVFIKRKRLTMPGRCPVCKKQHITRPIYRIDDGESETRSS